ncbi:MULTISPECIES: acyl-CoA dehydrogenase family protein [Ramlibacter]|uniref:Pimeloyl-CoA dehydrogenase small subunit n=1 Tax=Ramlibacter pinisoli TaxID=2682844 RepID=A0A6N8IYN0_9BURK|nr:MULTISPECIES: acyl-CoA dehydrogenase [Ramlibacter]MBA2961770.1 acyl-CoA dehydrogenase family protein [Ramlibacter sp. CGMCC 1.13660]MVQ31712.1 pimeloyl-CoA dehydrogenase small subunit [Ramlibacter pinisoli]
MSGLDLRIELSPEQGMLQDAAARYMEKAYGFQERQRIVASGAELDEGKWQDYARMGWLGLPLPEAVGGSGGSALDLFLLAQAFGRSLAVEPYLATVVLGAMTVAAAGTDQQRARILPGVAAGRTLLGWACAEPDGGYDLVDVQTQARESGAGFALTGDKSVVLGAASAHHLVVSARTAGPRHGRTGVSLFLVDRCAPGVTLRPYRTIDGRRAAEVKLDGVRVGRNDVLGELHGAAAHIERARALGTITLLGEAVGCLEGALACTIEYHKNRQQFGKPLSSFQALRHRVADLYVAKEETRALCLLAAHAWTADDPGAAQAIAGAKAWVGQTGRHAAEEAVQLHGAIAITDEYVVGHYLKRIVAIDRMFGDTGTALDEYLELGQGFAGAPGEAQDSAASART